VVDAGAADAGVVDGGQAPVDAGTSGGAAVDAGTATTHDAGTATTHDAGASGDGAHDAGTSGAHDAGSTTPTPHDAGPPATVGPDGGCDMVESDPADEGHNHVDAGSLVVYQHNPPTSGNHWPIWAKYMVHDEAVPREVYVHNLEHGAIALLVG